METSSRQRKVFFSHEDYYLMRTQLSKKQQQQQNHKRGKHLSMDTGGTQRAWLLLGLYFPKSWQSSRPCVLLKYFLGSFPLSKQGCWSTSWNFYLCWDLNSGQYGSWVLYHWLTPQPKFQLQFQAAFWKMYQFRRKESRSYLFSQLSDKIVQTTQCVFVLGWVVSPCLPVWSTF